MSESETVTVSTCRLCGLPCEQSIHIFDGVACINMLQYKIKQLLDIAVGRSDNLPHSVCLMCVNKLDSLWCFKNACLQVQIKLRKMRGLNRLNDANCDSLQPLNIVTSGFRTHDNDSSKSRPSHHEKELDLQSPSTSKSSSSADLLVNKLNTDECSDDLSKQKSTSSNIDRPNASKSLADYFRVIQSLSHSEKDYHNQLSDETMHSDSHLHSGNASISNDSETTLIHTVFDHTYCKLIDNNGIPDDDDDGDYNGIIEEDDSMFIVGREKVNVECNADITSHASSTLMNSALSESTGQSLADSNCPKVNESTIEVNSTSIVKVTEDNTCRPTNSSSSAQEQNDKNTYNTNEISSLPLLFFLSASTSGSEISQFFEGHYYRMKTDSNSDLLCNRIPYLLVKSEMGTKHMIYTITPDSSKFNNEYNYMLDPDGVYLTLEMFDLENPNVIRTLIEWLNNLIKGEISLIPYYFGWLDSKNQLNLGFKCILCKRCIDGNRRCVMNHIADHLLWTCPVCGRFFRSMVNIKYHLGLRQHESPTFECSTCGENSGGDFDKYKVHKRGHYKFGCFSCRFECSDEEKWLKHLKNDRKKVESCSSDCCLFYESLDEFRNHVSALATLGGYVCGACGMAYHCEEYLRLHLRVFGLEHGSKTTCAAVLPGSTGSENELISFQKKLDRHKYSQELTHFDTFKKILDNEIDPKEFQTSYTAIGGRVYTGFTCFKCNKNSRTEKKFRIHIETHLMMTCYQCHRHQKSTRELGNHFQRCGFKRRMCEKCKNDVWLNTAKEYLEHLSLHQKKTICIYCQKVLPTCQKLERHIISLHNTESDRHWFCEHCNESLVVTYKSLDAFKFNHYRRMHPDKLESFVCESCGKSFYTKHLLHTHKRNYHLAKKNNDTFICAYCSKEFQKRLSLICHIQQHMNEKNFKCEICEKSFNRETSLNKHKLDMHSVKKHACNLCEKRFTYPSVLADHMKRAHTCARSVKSKSSAK